MCRILLTAIAFAYLLCLLILSGVQKEELDINTLKKLKSHNVNIDDMSDPIVQQKCLFTPPSLPKITRASSPTVATVSTTTPFFNEIGTTTTPKNIPYDFIMKYFLQQKVTTESTTEKVTTNQINLNDDILKRDSINFYINSKLIKDDETNTRVVKNFNTKKNSIENVQNYWHRLDKDNLAAKVEMYKRIDAIKQQIPQKFAYSENKFEDTGRRNMDTINRFLSEYISRENNVKVTTPATTTNVYLIDIIEQISDFLRHNFTVQHNDNHSTRRVVNIQNSKEIVASKQAPAILQRRFTLTENAQKVQQSVSSSNTLLPAFSPSTLVEVAEDIKRRVLQELRKELMSSTTTTKPSTTPPTTTPSTTPPTTTPSTTTSSATTPSTTTLLTTTTTVSTTTKEVTTTPKQGKKIEENAQQAAEVIDSLIALIERFKTKKENTVPTQDTKHIVNKKPHVEQMYKNPKHGIINHKSKPGLTNTKQINRQPYIMQSYIMPQQKQQPIRNVNIQELHNYPMPYQTFLEEAPIPFQKPAPIMIQTNSNEIQPLVLPMIKPLNLIGQNIIIKTSQTITTTPNERNYWGHMTNVSNRLEQLSSARTKPPTANRISKLNHPGVKFKKRYQANAFQHTNRDKYATYSTIKPLFKFELDTLHETNQEKKVAYNIPKFETKLKNDIDKFHELLGKNRNTNEERGSVRVETSDAEVAERNIQPLNGVKREYDNTHYENLLKTQERVNDMLEKMLTSKAHNSFEVETND